MGNNLYRLRDLSSFVLQLDEYQEELRPFVELAQFITKSATCEINIIDAYNQWTIARTQDELKVLAKEDSICQHTVVKEGPHEVRNLKKDERYSDRPYVKGSPRYRHYCGVQLTTSDDLTIGSLCVLDTKPKKLSDQQKAQLQHIANAIVDKLEQERDLKAMVANLDELKDKFQKFNHDLRSPINGIVGFAEVLADGDIAEGTEEKLNIIRDCALTISDEMDAVLHAIDEKENKHQLRQKVGVAELPDKIERLYRPLAESKDIELVVHCRLEEHKELPNYFADKITQIVGNLVANALKFTFAGGAVEVLFDKREGGPLQITVADDGMGMEAEQVEAFNDQKDVYGTEGTAGEASFGIGLQHVRNLIRAEGGSVEVEAVQGKGTRFRIRMPL